ncbi:MAG: glucosaminidase domain-containing protein [Sarcina sp.]
MVKKGILRSVALVGIMMVCLNFTNNAFATEVDEISHDIDKYKLNQEIENYDYYNLKDYETDTKIKSASINYLLLPTSFDDYISSQEGKLHIISNGNKFVEASIDEVRTHADINFFSKPSDKFQFLELNRYREINSVKLNSFFKSLSIRPGNLNIYEGKAEIFKKAAKAQGIDPIYLVAHTLIETGNGNSQLAQGNYILLDDSGKAVLDNNGYVIMASEDVPANKKMKVYNFFGIGAVDSHPLIGGLTYAYKNGWTTIDKTIEGSAKWISTNYINSTNPKFKNQNTLYSMKWDFTSTWHQYATDVQWALKIANNMYKLAYLYEGNSLSFEIPLYKHTKDIPNSFKENKNVKYANKSIKFFDLYLNNKGTFQAGNEIFIYGETSDKNYFVSKDINGNIILISINDKNNLLNGLYEWKIDNEGYHTLVNTSTGKKVYSWFELYNNMYFFNDKGQMQVGWQYLGESWYYFSDTGQMQIGWQYLGESWYYFDNNGYMQTGWKIIDGKQYYFADNGYMQIGWQYLGESWYYFSDAGQMQIGWQYLGENWYYFANNGYMQTGWQVIDSKQYYFADNGYMQIGWQYLGGGWFYFYENGEMAENTVIDGFIIGENGYSNKI